MITNKAAGLPTRAHLIQSDRDIVLITCLLLTVVCCFGMALLFWPSDRFMSLGIAGAGVAGIINRVLLHRRAISFLTSAVILLTTVFYAIHFLSIVSAPNDFGVYWYYATILGAFFFLGARGGLIYTLCCLIALIFLRLNPTLGGGVEFLQLLIIVGSILCLATVALFYEQAVGRRTRELTRALREVHHLATTDYLTGLSNRRHFLDRAEDQFRKPEPLTAIALDLDNFKWINDTYGHAAGDQVLCDATEVLSSHLRKNALFGRTGGEEFMILLPVNEAIGRARAEELRRAVAKLNCRIGDTPVSITVSAGVSTRVTTDSSIDALLNRADRALYEAKRQGKNSVVTANIPADSCPA